MAAPLDALKSTLAALPEQDRAELADFLLETLDGDDPGWAEAWTVELSRRDEAIRSGETVGIPAEQVMDELRRKFAP